MRTNIISMFLISCLVCAPSWCAAQSIPPQDPSDVLKTEKEALAGRLRRARMEEEIIAYQRRQLDIEQEEIRKQQKLIARKERQLRTRPGRDTLKLRLEAQSNLLAQARRQLDEAHRNLASQIEILKSELARQELERRSFQSKLRAQVQQRRQEARESARRAREEAKRKLDEALQERADKRRK
ncbi:MAG TPA: hypothetical protein PLJ26_01145, partial [Candidatus Omnitrophota bacterium]|nr:hypothetical protein [Candidatus Omnitrophota bacterium]